MHRIQTAISDALQSASVAEASLFCTPGHKRGQGIPQQMQTLIGRRAYQADLPDLPGLGLFEPQSAVMAAQTLAAETFGADQTWFLVNGATVGVLAAILSVCGPGDKIILPRNVHRSAIGGLILSGALPIFVCPEYDPQTDLVHGTSVHSIAQALAQYPDVKAIFTVSPTYHGVCGDITAIAQLAHRANIPFIVDEAHGAHFGLHPSLPNSALAAGADLVVQSTHKTLGALTQAALLHRQGNRIDGTKVTATLQLLQSSSPSNLLLASLEAACAQIATQGDCLMAKTLTQAQQARQKIAALPNLTVLEKPLLPTPGFADLDTTRLTVTVSGLGLDGFEADELCTGEFGVIAELPTLRHLTFIISLGNTDADLDRLCQALLQLSMQYAGTAPLQLPSISPFLAAPEMALSPREAFFAPHISIPLASAIGKPCAETLCPYPPGIPTVLPGEIITTEALDYLTAIQSAGGFISGAADPSLQQIQVVA